MVQLNKKLSVVYMLYDWVTKRMVTHIKVMLSEDLDGDNWLLVMNMCTRKGRHNRKPGKKN